MWVSKCLCVGVSMYTVHPCVHIVCTEHACVNGGGLCEHMTKYVFTSDPIPSTLYLSDLRLGLSLRKKLQPLDAELESRLLCPST